MVTKVTLRQKPISENRLSLYLDLYPPLPHPITGKLTRREFLNMFIYDEIKRVEEKYHDGQGKEQKRFVTVKGKKGDPIKIRLDENQKKHNFEIWTRAEQIRNKRENEINKPEIYFGYEQEQLKIKEKENKSFLEYFEELVKKRKSSNHDNWISAYNYLVNFTNGKLRFADLNEKFCNDFKDYLLTNKRITSDKPNLSQNTALAYFNKFKAALKQAYQDELIQKDLNGKINPIKPNETIRNFLTMEELNALVKTECENPMLKNAALFSALTGLRFSDIIKLKWDDVEYIRNSGYYIHFVQQKTKGVETMPISEQAYKLMGEPKGPDEQVFKDLTYSAYTNTHMAKWLGLAGITKKITFHCFRHTYATQLLSHGTDIYTVSKMLGHRSLSTTQIYTKVLDKAKREAADKIKLDF